MFRYRESIGLHISDGVAKAVHVRRHFGVVRIVGHDSVPLSGQTEEDAELLVGLFKRHGWLNVPCIIGLSGESLMLRVMACPEGSARGVKNFVDEQVEHLGSLSNSSASMEYLVSRRRGGTPIVLIGMARMDTVLSELDYSSRIGLNVVDVVPGPLALYNAVSYLAPWSFAPVACVDISVDSTQVVVGEGNTLFFARRFLMGSQHLTVDLDISAQGELFESNNKRAGPSAGRVHRSERFEEWLAELDGCISFYSSRLAFGGKRVGRIVVSGMSDFGEEWLRQIESSCSSPALLVSDLPRADRVGRDSEVAVATGLGLSGVGREKIGMSLLPKQLKEKFALKWQTKYWLTSGLALVMAAALATLRLRVNMVDEMRILKEEKELAARLERHEAELGVLDIENRALGGELISLRAAVDNARMFETILTLVSDSKNQDDWISLIADVDSYFGEEISGLKKDMESIDRKQQVDPPPIDPFSKIVVEGYTPLDDLSTVRKMIEKLRENKKIIAADLLPDDKIRQRPEATDLWDGYSGTRFAIEISLVES